MLRALEKALSPCAHFYLLRHFSCLGLVEMTRKRTRESLEHVLCETCPTCEGRGTIKAAETICYEIFRWLREHGSSMHRSCWCAAHDVVDLLVDEESRAWPNWKILSVSRSSFRSRHCSLRSNTMSLSCSNGTLQLKRLFRLRRCDWSYASEYSSSSVLQCC